MNSKYRIFCPKSDKCKIKNCAKCKLANNDEKAGGDENLQHEINKNYLKSIGRICLCAECCDR